LKRVKAWGEVLFGSDAEVGCGFTEVDLEIVVYGKEVCGCVIA
jgi:hypothetical protein